MLSITYTRCPHLHHLAILVLLILPFSLFAQISGSSNVCVGETYVYTLNNGIVYTVPSWTASNGTVTSTTSSGTTYTATVQWGSVGSGTLTFKNKSTTIANLTTTINVIPGTPNVSNNLLCAKGSINATPGTNANTCVWYDASGTNLLASGNTSPFTNFTTTYLVASLNSTTGCKSSLVTVTLTIILRPLEPIVAPATFCGSGSIVATPGANGNAIRWYTSATGGSYTQNATSPLVTATTTFYAVSLATATGCESDPRTPVTISIEPVPTITASGSTLFTYGSPSLVTLSTSSTFAYRWIKDGTNVGTSQSYPTSFVGNYQVATKTSASAMECTSSTTRVGNILTAQPQAVNFVSTTRIFKKGLTTESSLYSSVLPNEIVQAVVYQDGLGRTFQTVAVGLSPNQTDLVSPIGYGKQGLVDSTFLPYATGTKQGTFRLNAIRANNSYNNSEQKLFYQNTAQVANDAKPFARTVHRASLDARVTEQGAPGTDWQPGTNHTVRNTIALNNATYPVRFWKPDGTTTENYPNGTVMVSITTDENGNQVRTYTNKQGQTILKQVQLDETINSAMVNWLDTYYIYDAYGRLVYQVPPKAMAILGSGTALNANNVTVAELIYKYTYDIRGRVAQKKVPGAAVQYIVYDKLNRAVLTQDGNQRASKKWAFVKYDIYGRAVYSGIYTNTAQTTLAAVQALFDGIVYTALNAYESPTVNATTQGYTNGVFPTSNLSVMAANYYDDYDFDRNGKPDYTYDAAHLTGLPTAASSATRNLPTGSRKLIVGTSNWLVSTIFYDALDRPIQTQSNNHLNMAVQDKSSIKYIDNDLTTHVDKTKMTHAGPSVVTVEQRYTYDHAWRTKAIFHKLNGGSEVQVAGYTYNALGQVVDKQLHVVSGTPLQSVDLRYTIRGWLKSINNAQLASDNGVTNSDPAGVNDLFGMELLHNTTEAGLGNMPYYNGNVSAAKWKGANMQNAALENTNGVRSFTYAYDKSDKLKTATFAAQDVGNTWAKQQNTLNETMAYDHNGNMLTLTRNQNQRALAAGSTPSVTSAAQTVDNLTYTYTANTNSMAKVEDAVAVATGTGDFKNNANNAIEYTYTPDGSMAKDDNKGIASITYNILGKPQVVTYSGTPTKTVTYTYDAAGTKLKTVTVAGSPSVTTTTDYVGSFVYTNKTLSFFSSPEGRIVKNGANYEYQYAIADHQGNTRLIFTSATPTAQSVTATFEGDANDKSGLFNNVVAIPSGSANHTVGGSKVVRLNQATPVGPGFSKKVYPGDKVDLEAYSYYEAGSGYGTASIPLATIIAGVSGTLIGGGGDPGGLKAAGANNALSFFGVGANQGDNAPAAFLNYILFDANYKVLNAGWQVITPTAFAKNKVSLPSTINVAEAGYIYAYVSYENQSNNFVYFDDFKVTVTPTNIVQYNEYYPFQALTQNSWTRENTMGNNFLGNGGTELNTTTGVMDLEYRQFDPVLGRMNQVDPLADNFPSHTPYNYSFNAPTVMNDPLGDAPLYTETERILHGLPMSGGRVMDYGTAGGHITRGSGGHWADGLDMGADLVWMSRSTFERFYNVNLSNPNHVWNVALGVSTAASGDVQYDRNSTESYRVFLNGGRVPQVIRLYTARQMNLIATANRLFGYGGAGPMQDRETVLYSNGKRGLEPRINGIMYELTLSENWVLYPEGYKMYFSTDFKTLLWNPVNPSSYFALLFSLSEGKDVAAGFVDGYKASYDRDFFVLYVYPFIAPLGKDPGDKFHLEPKEPYTVGFSRGIQYGNSDRERFYPSMFAPKETQNKYLRK
jgi:RHS repeat-associated protein